MRFTPWRITSALFLVASAGLSLSIFTAPDPAYRWAELIRSDQLNAQDATIAEVAAQAGIEPALIKAIAWQESRLDQHAESSSDARGLMQIGAGTATEWAAFQQIETFLLTDLFDTRTNLQVGAWYLRRAMDRWKDAENPIAFALADYAAGPEAVSKWSAKRRPGEPLTKAIDDPQVREFVERVLEHCHRLRTAEFSSR